MRILLVSFYYRPDLSACSFRSTALVEALRAAAPPGSTIDVVTSAPNRYRSFAVDAPQVEHDGAVTITRIPLPAHRSGLLDQSRAFLAFARGAMRAVASRDYDVVIATSSRLMTAVLGTWIGRRKRARVYLDIRDIFVDTLTDVLPRRVSWAAKAPFALLERWALRSADTVNLVSRGFAEYFRTRYPRQRFSFHTNGIDDVFLQAAEAPLAPTPERTATRDAALPRTVVYAGNIGEGQGLHAILPGLAAALGPSVRFRIIGDGGRRAALESAIASSGVANVEVCDPLPRAELLQAYRDADVLLLHLNDHAAFEKVLPSKIFEYAALGKPVWAGVAGYAAEFVRTEIENAAVFRPCDVADAVRALGTLSLEDRPRAAFRARYARAAISRAMAADIVAVARER